MELPDEEISSIAEMLICQAPRKQVALAHDIAAEDLDEMLANKESRLSRVIKKLQAREHRLYVDHRKKLKSYVPLSHKAIEGALVSEDKKLAADTGWKVLDTLIPKAPEQIEVKGGLEVHHSVDFGSLVQKMLGDKEELVGGSSFLDRVTTGKNALPRPVAATITARSETE